MQELQTTISQIATPGKGILAADESSGTIQRRFNEIQLESTEHTRRVYRELLLSTPGINAFIAGVILYDETIKQTTESGQSFVELLTEQGIIPGIKVDKGLIPLTTNNKDTLTEGLDGLAQRLKEYKKMGARFAKWRAAFYITNDLPSRLSIMANAEDLARYAFICQSEGIVPIVEPEVLIDGNHTLARCALVSEAVLEEVFVALDRYHVKLEYIILKPSMILPGKQNPEQATVTQVAEATLNVLKRCVPVAVPTINFLSGGQSPDQACANLNAMNQLGPHPWNLSFSFARALQESALKIWKGKPENVNAAQQAFYHYSQLNSAASLGKMEK